MSNLQKQHEQQQQKNLEQFNKFLKNNNELLQQKYKQHFVQDKIKITNKQPKIETVVNFIADVFLIQGNEQVKQPNNKQGSQTKIKQSLRHSYQNFIKTNKDIKQFNCQIAIQLLRFCIVSNQMFAVQYQNSKQTIQQKIQKDGKNQNNKQQQLKNKQIQRKQSEQEGGSVQQKEQQKDNPSESNQFALMKGPSQQNQVSNNKSKSKIKNRNSFDDGELENQFNFHEEIKLDLDPVQVKKNLRIVFDYYCKQQMALAPNLSFDRIQRQSHMLTLNKLLLMARMMNMISGVITREAIVSKFRKISQGKKQIDFKKFDIMMSQLQIQDSTLIARAELNSPNIHLYLKTTKKPFDTQDMQPRQLIKVRAFNKKITEHSGKMEQDLLQNLKQKKSAIIQQNMSKLSPSIIKMKQYSESILKQIKDTKDSKQLIKGSRQQSQKQANIIKDLASLNSKQSQILNPKKLANRQRNYSYDLSLIKLKKIIPVQQQDEKWLGEYKISSSIKRAQAYDQNLEKRRSFQDNQRNSVLIRDLKNRVKQFQMVQNSSSGLDQTKPFLISPNKKY